MAVQNPLARDPAMLEMLRERVERKEWERARRLAIALGLHKTAPPFIGERRSEYLERLAEQFAKVA